MNNNNKRKRTTTTRETLSEIGPFRIPNFREGGEAEEKEGTLELTARTVAHIAREICKFLLFQRNQIPLLYEDLISLRLLRREEEEEEEEEETEEEEENATTKKKRKRKSKKKSSKRSQKKLSNQIAQVERALMESLSEEEFASRRPVKRVAVCFGATANRPVETYIIDLEDVRYSARGIEEEEEEAMREKKTKSAANRIVRAVMPHVAGLRTNPSRTSQKIWIFLRHEDTTSDIDDENDERSAHKIETSNLFAMKRNLDGLFEHEEEEEEEEDKRGKRKNVKGNVFARIVLKSSSKPSSVIVPTPSCSWYQSRLVPKGFRFKETVR
jgi:hypothetical protein